MSKPKYPEIEVTLVGQNGNVFNIVGIVDKALRKGGVSKEERVDFFNEAVDGDYDHLLVTCMKWVTCN